MSEREFRRLKSDMKRHQTVTRQRFAVAIAVMLAFTLLTAFKSTNLRSDYGFVNGSHLVTAEGVVINGFDSFAARNSQAGLNGKKVLVEYNTQRTPSVVDDVALRLTVDGENWLLNENLSR